MAAPRKYLFDVTFDPVEPAPASGARKAAAAAVAPSFSQVELDTARQEGFAAGEDAGRRAAAEAAEAHGAAAMAALAQGLRSLVVAAATHQETAERGAATLVRAVLHKLVPAYLRKDPLAEIEALIAACCAEAPDEPRLVLRVSDALFDNLQSRLEPIAAASGFAGKFVLLADGKLGPADARVEWADGGAERDTRRTLAAIDAAIDAFLAAPPAVSRLPEESSHE